MLTSTAPDLSADELLHLAIADSRGGRHDEAIVKLKRCLEQAPSHAAACHMLAAEHAEIGMFPDAIRELQRAIALEPDSIAAHFQLGQLYLITGDPRQAGEQWAAVLRLDADGPWGAFSQAMTSLATNDVVAAVRYLDRGLGDRIVNQALRDDMLRLRGRLASAPGSSATADDAAGQAGAMLLKRYDPKPE